MCLVINIQCLHLCMHIAIWYFSNNHQIYLDMKWHNLVRNTFDANYRHDMMIHNDIHWEYRWCRMISLESERFSWNVCNIWTLSIINFLKLNIISPDFMILYKPAQTFLWFHAILWDFMRQCEIHILVNDPIRSFEHLN